MTYIERKKNPQEKIHKLMTTKEEPLMVNGDEVQAEREHQRRHKRERQKPFMTKEKDEDTTEEAKLAQTEDYRVSREKKKGSRTRGKKQETKN